MKISETTADFAGVMRCCMSAFEPYNDGEKVTDDIEVEHGHYLPCKFCSRGMALDTDLPELKPWQERPSRVKGIWRGSKHKGAK